MYLKVKHLIEDLTGFTIYRKNTPWGVNLYNDISRLVPGWSPQVIFDVGANIGQTALDFHREWSNAKIFSFEPVKDTFTSLVETLKTLPNTEAFNLALGAESQEATIKVFWDSRLATLDHYVSINPDIGDKALDTATTKYEPVKIATIDEFCTLHSINKINLLKIDTEGYDLEVLKGATALLESNKIDLILVEVSANTFPGKISISEISLFLKDYGINCVGIYNQAFWLQKHLYYGNALFVRKSLLS